MFVCAGAGAGAGEEGCLIFKNASEQNSCDRHSNINDRKKD